MTLTPVLTQSDAVEQSTVGCALQALVENSNTILYTLLVVLKLEKVEPHEEAQCGQLQTSHEEGATIPVEIHHHPSGNRSNPINFHSLEAVDRDSEPQLQDG